MRHPTTRTDVKTRPKLSELDVERLRLIARGYTNEAIARVTNTPTSTTGRHLTALFEKIGARDRTEAAAFALVAEVIKVTDLNLPTWIQVELHARREAITSGG